MRDRITGQPPLSTSLPTTIQRSEHVERRLRVLRDEMARRSAGAFLTSSPATQTYLTGFRALLYSRPILLSVAPEATTLVVPGLEEAHARLDDRYRKTVQRSQ